MEKELLIKNTRRLAADYNLDIPIVEKLEILELLSDNLKDIKSHLDADTFEKELGILNRSVEEKLKNVTDPDFLSQLILKIKNVLKNYENPSSEVLRG